MKDDQDRREGELISLRAAEWLVRLYGGPSPGQPRDYWRWLKKSQEHVIAHARHRSHSCVAETNEDAIQHHRRPAD